MNNISASIDKLLDEQLKEWPLAQSNFEALNKVKSKEFEFDGFKIRVQFNPARIQSTAAKVDSKSIQERKCFLCPANLPPQQRGLDYDKDYQILVNPFPIFAKHFTIPTYEHTDQLIRSRYGDMLNLAKDMSHCSIFYNGPKCGASAPDHAHFQAGNKGFMPLDEEVKNRSNKLIYKYFETEVYLLKNYLRNGFLIVSKDKQQTIRYFEQLYSLLDINEGEKEPMLNIITWYENDTWYSAIFPRAKHRPDCFYAEGEENILISPASVDMGGVFITPQEKDFDKIKAEDIKQIYEEVCMSDDKINLIVTKLNTLWSQK